MDHELKPPVRLKRNYSDRTLKILFALSGNRCAFPGCPNPIVASATAYSGSLVVGQIAHIYALSEDGPRGRAGFTEADLNQPSNLILFCPTDHVRVDGQHETYPASLLTDWKLRHEQRYAERISASVSDVGFAELEVAARSLMSSDTAPDGTYAVVPPKRKILKNSLGTSSEMLLVMGASKSGEVASLFVKMEQIDPGFPERLSSGFVSKYENAVSEGMTGDILFAEIYGWAAGESGDRIREAAGLCILSHLFVICDVFEKD